MTRNDNRKRTANNQKTYFGQGEEVYWTTESHNWKVIFNFSRTEKVIEYAIHGL